MPPPKNELIGKAGAMPCTQKEVDDWVSRVDNMTQAIQSFLTADPEEEDRRKQLREQRRLQEQRELVKERTTRRYNTHFYTRFDDAGLIDKMLKEVDENETKGRPKHKIEELSDFERLSLEQAVKLKTDANILVAKADFENALKKYETAIGLEPMDDDLVLALHNNASLCALKTGNSKLAVERASYVINRDKNNSKALLRRASALVNLHKIDEALNDIERVRRSQPNNVEAAKLQTVADREKQEYNTAEVTRQLYPKEVEKIIATVRALEDALKQFAKVKDFKKTTQESVVVAADSEIEKAEEKLIFALVECGAILAGHNGFATIFRLSGGTAVAEDVALRLGGFHQPRTTDTGIEQAPAFFGDPALVDYPAGIVLVASCLRVLSKAYDTNVAALLFSELEPNSRRTPLLVTILKYAKHDNALLSCAAIQCAASIARISSMCSDAHASSANEVLSSIDTALFSLIPDWLNDDLRAVDAVTLLERMLVFPPILQRCYKASTVWLPPLLENLHKGSWLQREAAAVALMRLSLSSNWQNELTQPLTLNSLLNALLKSSTAERGHADPTMLRVSGWSQHAYFAEALLALLHNLSVKMESRSQISEAIGGNKDLLETMVSFLSNAILECERVTKSDKFESDFRVVTRIVSLFGKLAKVDPVAQRLREKDCFPVIAKLLLLDLTAKDRSQLSASDVEFIETCRESVTLILAVAAGDLPAPCPVVIQTLVAHDILQGLFHYASGYCLYSAPSKKADISDSAQNKYTPLAIGNAATCLSNLITPTSNRQFMSLVLAGQNCNVDDVNISKLTPTKPLLDCIVKCRSNVDEINHQIGQKPELKITSDDSASQLLALWKGAQKNVAVLLGKCASLNSGVVDELRASRGFEILYAAMDKDPKFALGKK